MKNLDAKQIRGDQYSKDIEMLDSIINYAMALDHYITIKTLDKEAHKSFDNIRKLLKIYPDYILIPLVNSGLDVLVKKNILFNKTRSLTIRVDGFNAGYVIGRRGTNIQYTLNNIKRNYPDSILKHINVATELDPDIMSNKLSKFTEYLLSLDLTDVEVE